MKKGILQQVQAGPSGGSSAYSELMSAFDTDFTPASGRPRYLWWGPIGHLKFDAGRMFVVDEGQQYRPASRAETEKWNEFVNSIKSAQP